MKGWNVTNLSSC